ncbi:MAG: hypothetical protein PHC66_00285 [Candidatus Nanoarchaeia archaeon]|nr:hypothetical protein [Candidatus Nanoarchaeia archaeon]MDD5239613.1 hypothetical protein [Candidatus Nanoarchaeia archaeon]
MAYSTKLKYGINPHNGNASMRMSKKGYPIEILNGNPGTVNLLEALRGIGLVAEIDKTFDMPAAAALKHKNAAGAAIGLPLDDVYKNIYFCADKKLTQLAAAYLRAEGTDPKSAYGGTTCLSRTIDVPTALEMKKRVIDVVVAPGYEPEALEILKKKKESRMVIIQYDPKYELPPQHTINEGDVEFTFDRDNYKVTNELLEDVVGAPLTENETRDLKLGAVIAKYTKSNKTIYTIDGQTAGVMPGQMSRVDSIRWAGEKSIMWLLRQSEEVQNIKPIADKLSKSMYDKIQLQTQIVETFLNGKTKTEKRVMIKDVMENRKWDSFRATTCGFLPFVDNITEAYNNCVGSILYPKAPSKGIRFPEISEEAKKVGIKLCLFPYRLFRED